ncbi:hypothetical protein PybrP1_008783 [[Pythium] brassicae (nom. inval.)]|nr:hypothetical protein PybrP1_008783 [[Pythium] brassicae (nom. inval.)]
MVAVAHAKTTGRFLVNGYLSAPIPVACGIRQGCPLAPLLFILAIKALYQRMEARSDICGFSMPTTSGEETVRIADYADDTALYLQDAHMTSAAMEELSLFGAASGLRTNVRNSVVVPLGEAARAEGRQLDAAPPLLQEGTTCRYLGIQVSDTDAEAVPWGAMMQGFRCRLRFAIAKTHTVMQRAEIARAIVVPKVL